MGQENGIDHSQNGDCGPDSGLARIDFTGSDPIELFREWHAEARASHLVNPDAFCFSTCGKEGKPSSRHLMLRKLEDDGFMIMTDSRSRKSADLAENPHCSLTFLWSYIKDNKKINKQVRIEGLVEELSQSARQEIWEREPLFCKIRANLCDQGQPVDWDEHKRNHDQLYEEAVKNNRIPVIPNHVICYKVIPSFMDFYFAFDNYIADRLAFHRADSDVKIWKVERIAA